MPALAALSLKNNAAVATSFTPINTDASGISTFMSSEVQFDLRKKVTAQVALPKAGSSVSRLRYRVTVPVVDASGAKVGEVLVDVGAVIPKVASATNAMDALSFTKDLLATAAVSAAFDHQEGFF